MICSGASLLLSPDVASCDPLPEFDVFMLPFQHNLFHPFSLLHCTPPLASSVQHTGNISLEDVYSIARTMRPRSIAKEFSGTVKEILGTSQSVGCKVEGKHPHDWIDAINEGTLEVPVSTRET